MRASFAFVAATVAALCAACPPAPFNPGEVDAGNPDDVVTADEIGTPCTYDDRNPANPTNQCAAGTECVIATHDNSFNPLQMAFPFWEDQLTVTVDEHVDIGYCTVVGNAVTVAACPVGTILKFVRSNAAAGGFASLCLKPCTASSECGADRVCDVRYADPGSTDNVAFCVSPCRADLSHCVRTAVVTDTESGNAVTALFDGDLFGDSVCNEQTGICASANNKNAAGTDGAQCSSSADCATGLACYQKQLFTQQPDFGFCATRCNIDAPDGARPEQGTCSVGQACQPGMAFGYTPTPDFRGMMVFDNLGNLATREGICLDVCTEGVTECTPGATCGATDVTVTGQTWNQTEMCVPPAIKAPG